MKDERKKLRGRQKNEKTKKKESMMHKKEFE